MNKTILKFWGAGCVNCRAMDPMIDEIKADFPDIDIVAIDIDAAPDMAEKYEITALPTLIFLRNNEYADRLVGLKPKSHIAKKIELVYN